MFVPAILAVITAVPLSFAVTCPLRFTVATLFLLEVQIIFFERLLDMFTLNLILSPLSTTEPTLFNRIDACGRTLNCVLFELICCAETFCGKRQRKLNIKMNAAMMLYCLHFIIDLLFVFQFLLRNVL
jgi:hypothetical protein